MKLPSTSEHPAAAGCISGFLNRLRRPPAAPTDLAAEEAGTVTAKKAATTAAPGIVARLMGLDSMPVHPYPLPVHVARSRSTNTLDSWPVLISTHKRASSDPAIRAPVSFCEVPAYLTRENEEFLLLSLASDNGEGKAKMSFQELKVEKDERRYKRMIEIKGQRQNNMRRDRCRENYPERSQSDVKGSGVRPRREAQREPRSAARRERPIRNRKKLARAGRRHEDECSCQDSSPVSVLDDPWDTDGEYSQSPASEIRTRRTQFNKTSDRSTKPRQMDSKKKLLSDLADRKDASLSIHNKRISGDGGIATVHREKNEISQSQQTQKDFSVMWGLVCRMAEEDVKASCWLSRRIQDAGEIATLVGVELLDFLLYEVVAEFSYCHTTTLNCK